VVLEELRRQTFVGAVILREYQGDEHEVEAEHAHPARRVRLFEHRAVGERVASVNGGDVVEPEEAALEDVVALRVHLVHPPCEVDEELVEALLKELAVGATRAYAIHVVDAPDGPSLHGRVEVRELPLVGGYLAVRVLE